MLIKIATRVHSAIVANLHINSWRTTYRGMLPDDFLEKAVEVERYNFWKQRLELPSQDQLVLLAEEDDNTYLGFICIRLNADKQWGTMIDNLHVATNEKGKGIGTQLMEEATTWILDQAPNDGVWLWAYEQNKPARCYYEGLLGREVETCMLPSTAGNSVSSIRYAWESPQQLLDIIASKKKSFLQPKDSKEILVPNNGEFSSKDSVPHTSNSNGTPPPTFTL